jgi:hypothetical protein
LKNRHILLDTNAAPSVAHFFFVYIYSGVC